MNAKVLAVFTSKSHQIITDALKTSLKGTGADDLFPSMRIDTACPVILLGFGHSGVVLGVTLITGLRVAAKFAWLNDVKSQQSLFKEIVQHLNISHPHIAKALGVVKLEPSQEQFLEQAMADMKRDLEAKDEVVWTSTPDTSRMFMTYFYGHGNLKRYLEKLPAPLSFKQKCELALQIITALTYLHGRKLLHRDLLPRNIFLQEVDNQLVAYIGDLGLVCDAGYSGEVNARDIPSEITQDIIMLKSFEPSTDVLLLGSTLISLLSSTGHQDDKKLNEPEPPTVYGSYRPQRALTRINVPPKPESVPLLLWQVVETCVFDDPTKRPTLQEVADAVSNALHDAPLT
jgi:serine/threonine protein kinase